MKVSGLVLAESKVPGSAGPGLPCAFSDCAFLKTRLHAPALRRQPWPSPHATSAFIASRALWAGCPSPPPPCTRVLVGRMGTNPRGPGSRRGHSILQACVPTPPLLATLCPGALLTWTPEPWEGPPTACKLGRALGYMGLRPAWVRAMG